MSCAVTKGVGLWGVSVHGARISVLKLWGWEGARLSADQSQAQMCLSFGVLICVCARVSVRKHACMYMRV